MEEHGAQWGLPTDRVVCLPTLGSCSDEDYFLWVPKGHQSRKRRQCDWRCAFCGEQYDWPEANRVPTKLSPCRPEDTLEFKAPPPDPASMRQQDQRLEAPSELAGGREHHRGRV